MVSKGQRKYRSKLRRFEAETKIRGISWMCKHRNKSLNTKTVYKKCKPKNQGLGCSQLLKIQTT